MLPQRFLEWWYAPWKYAGAAARLAHAEDAIALRDGYRLWCEQAHVTADLPSVFDADWHIACTENGDELRGAARLFAGLFAARNQEHEVLKGLPEADSTWCAGIASTQPLQMAVAPGTMESGDLEIRGLAELGTRLEAAFPGIWSRLRLMLPEPAAANVDAILKRGGPAAPGTCSPAAAARLRRCWQICLQRANGTLQAGSA